MTVFNCKDCNCESELEHSASPERCSLREPYKNEEALLLSILVSLRKNPHHPNFINLEELKIPTAISKMGLKKDQKIQSAASLKVQRRPVFQLARQLRNNCNLIFDESIPFVIEAGTLIKVVDSIEGVFNQREVEESESSLEWTDCVLFLSDFIAQSPSLCISTSTNNNGVVPSSPSSTTTTKKTNSTTTTTKTNSTTTTTTTTTIPSEESSSSQGSMEQKLVDITLFKNLSSLELRNTKPGQLKGLHSIRSKLIKLKVSRSLNSLSQILSKSAQQGPRPQPQSSSSSRVIPCMWPELKEIDLSFNKIGGTLDLSDIELFEFCPSVELLNLSRNRLISLDDKFSRSLTSLCVLNLSYNQLSVLPPIPPSVQKLYLSHNFISSLGGGGQKLSLGLKTSFSLPQRLQVLDLSTNLISKEEDLNPLKQLNCLEKLLLMGNPISFMEAYRRSVSGYLNRLRITRQFELDKKLLSSSEVRWGREQCKEEKFVPYVPISLIGNAGRNAGLVGKGMSSSRGQIDLMTQSYDSSSSSVQSTKRKKAKIREILTLEEDEEGLTSTLEASCSSIASTLKGRVELEASSSTSSLALLNTGRAVSALREKYGAEYWLLRQAGGELDRLLQIPQQKPVHFISEIHSKSLPQSSSCSRKIGISNFDKNSLTYYKADDGRGGGSKNAASSSSFFSSKSIIDNLSNKPSSSISLGLEEQEEEEGSEFYSCFSESAQQNMETSGINSGAGASIFDIASEEERFDESAPAHKGLFQSFKIFQTGQMFKLIVYDGYLIEVDPEEDNILLHKWDLNCLQSLEEERCDEETESVEFRLKFDTLRKQMRERSFIMGAKEFKIFDTLLSPFIEARMLNECFSEALQCTKCGAQFAAGMAAKKFDGGGASLSVCPSCGNHVLVTLDSIPLPNNEILDLSTVGGDNNDLSSLTRRGPLRTSTPVSAAPSKNPKIGSQSIPKSEQAAGRSPFEFFRKLPSSLTSRKALTIPPPQTHDLCDNNPTPTPSQSATNTKSDSDIEVLSNDSSSIEVLVTHCRDASSDSDQAEAEEAIEIPILESSNKSLRTVIMSESNSSSSCADSVITTYERYIPPTAVPPAPVSSSPLNPVRYDYINFARTDHRLQLWAEISVFKSADEKLLALLKCLIISSSSPTSGTFTGILIFSNKKVYLYKITGPEGDKPQEWLKKMGAFDLSKFGKLDVLLGRHGVGLEFGSKYFALIFRDSQRTSSFLEFFMSDICGELDNPPMVRDFSQTQKTMLSPRNPISYFGVLRLLLCDNPENCYAVSGILLTNEEILVITDLSWMAGCCDRVSTRHGRALSTLRQVESMELCEGGWYLRLMFEGDGRWELWFETEAERSVFKKCLRSEVNPQIPFINLSQPLPP